jgi:hypothetical protein
MTDVTIPSSSEDRKKIKTMLTEATHCMQRAEDERQSIKEIIDDAYAKFDIPKKILRKIATTMYKHNYEDVTAENDDFESLYEILVNSKNAVSSEQEDAQ